MYPELSGTRRHIVGGWLAAWSAMIMLVVVIGGITRLTESGLSITEWAPISGILPPLTQQSWQDAFQAYQQIPEYQELNRGMTLSEFKSIYFWEYVHRVWARLIGLAIALPLLFFWIRGWLPRSLRNRLVLLVVLTGAQGALGWIMVQSGLADRTDVSQYRLAAHLGLALLIYVLAVWTAADLLAPQNTTAHTTDSSLTTMRRLAGGLTTLVFITAIAGAFVAGINGGMAYNSFPLMGGRLVPAGYLTLEPWWKNIFENVAAVQFNHRWIGILTFVAVIAVWYRGKQCHMPNPARLWLHLLPAIALLQVVLGIVTLILAVPIPVAALHQTGAVALLTTCLLLYHGTVRTQTSSA